MRAPTIVALEIGTSKVRVVIGEAREHGVTMILGVGECDSRGIRKGEVLHNGYALKCVKNALQAAEEQAQITIEDVHLVLSGGHITPTIHRGSVPVLNSAREVTDGIISDVMEAARAVSLAPERHVIHSINQLYILDDDTERLDPHGLSASRISLDALLLHGDRDRLVDMFKVVQNVPMDIRDVAFSGLCVALSVLTPAQKESGAMVIDLGGGTVDYAVYANQCIATAGTLGVGGDHVTNDLALGFRIHTAQAETLKIEHGSASKPGRRDQVVSVPPEGGFDGRDIYLKDIHAITHARMDETFRLLKEEVMSKLNLQHKLTAGVIITGGGADMKNVCELAESIFEMPCRIGRPRDFIGLAEGVERPEFAAVTGMVRYGLKGSLRSGSGPKLVEFIKDLLNRR